VAGIVIQADLTLSVTAKSVACEQVTREPSAVRHVRVKGRSGNFVDTATSLEITEYWPWHMVSIAQINADDSGGGREGFGGVMKPMNVGGGNSSG